MNKVEQRRVVLLTLDRGAVPATSIHLYCEACKINYHHNYKVDRGQRTYYEGVPVVLQIGEHHFAEVQLINAWINLMVLAWVSATNCARWYNVSIAMRRGHHDTPWQFKLGVTSDQVYDGFTILSLLEDCARRQTVLQVSHTGDEKVRFAQAVFDRNERLREGGLGYHYHSCTKCTRRNNDNTTTKVVVIDGVTLGHPCCGVHNCTLPLKSNRHRYCPKHLEEGEDTYCCVVGCRALAVGSTRSCLIPSHITAVKERLEMGKARFYLKSQLEKSKAVQIISSLPRLADDDENDHDEHADVSDVEIDTESSDPTGKGAPKIRVQAGRTRTHNQQLFVAPCGLVIARDTFYGAEAVGSVVKMIEKVYKNPDTCPNHIFFDNNCILSKMVKGKRKFFDDIGLTVDVFHFGSKHKVTDLYCQTKCNPAHFEELQILDDNGVNQGWYFNSSVAEQTNAWIGGYLAICREMRVDRFNFFLDEMILRRNAMILDKLHKAGANPFMYVPT
ncbi:hypothetical protein DFP72DRAFT_886318 [Ephemerocybe angulata]|uniref:CxC6 like cysteine cluster associated with KDZ domain-containing protein n=1 Tax=Ephemerocybe angulata TaxID=980116 RepID=A0A8H6H5W7_9AGAR|nr:hypothetical protein DFP72DRAFT_947409 [Tulosesus angulatus]KAF6758761.1 hypothetical protein DFP72DRAFT_886318 [Tulosesus angulatus]